MMTREPKTEWITAKVTGPDRAILERYAADLDGNLSAALRHVIRLADRAERTPRRTRQGAAAAGGVG